MHAKVELAVATLKTVLRPEDIGVALRSAVAKTTTTFITRSSRGVGQVLNTKIGSIKEQFSVSQKANKTDATAEVLVKRKPVPVIDYMSGAQVAASWLRPPGGARVRVRRGGVIEQHKYSFVAKMKSGHIGLFHRGTKSRSVRGAKRKPIYEERGPTTVSVLANNPDPESGQTILDTATGQAVDVLVKNIESQMDRFLAKYAQQT